MEKYAQYITPRMKSVDLDIIQPVTLTIEDRLRQLCNPDQHASTDSEAED